MNGCDCEFMRPETQCPHKVKNQALTAENDEHFKNIKALNADRLLAEAEVESVKKRAITYNKVSQNLITKNDTLTAEVKRLSRWPDYFAWEREYEKLKAENQALTAEVESLGRLNKDCYAKRAEMRDKINNLKTALENIVDYDEARRNTASRMPSSIPESVVCKIAKQALKGGPK